MPMLTAEIFTIPLAETGRYLVYAPLRHAAFVANARTVNLLASLRNGEYTQSDDPDGALVKFLRQLQIVDGGPETEPITTFAGQPHPVSLTLFLTTACNLRCTYCYASAGDTAARSMPLAVAMRGIDFVAGNAVKKGVTTFDITYHGGGEPTTHWHVLTESLEYARRTAAKLGLAPPHASVASNGVLRDDQIDWIIANVDGGASISLDGSPAVNDRHRLTVLGNGSSERVARTLRRFDAAGYPYGIRVTVTADNIARLPESIDYICGNFSATRVQVEPSYQLGRWSEAPTAETAEFITAYRQAQARAAAHGKEIFFSGARAGALSNHFCGVTQDTFALSPDGNVSACYEVFSEENPLSQVFFYGSPSDSSPGYSFNLPVLNHLRDQGVQNREFCQGCFAKWTCSGDCYHKSIRATGSLEFEGTDRCHITRELTKDQILAQIASSGGLFWRGEAPSTPTVSAGKEVLL